MSDISTEPTMEEILSSIKKIIADDSDKGLSPARPRRIAPREPTHDVQGEVADEAQDNDILELSSQAPAEPEPAALVSPTAEAASRNALESLTVAVAKPAVTGGETIEGLVRQMLTPMLKDWLDAHLPEVVERVVAQEVARISGR
jgi:uncharacterized protein